MTKEEKIRDLDKIDALFHEIDVVSKLFFEDLDEPMLMVFLNTEDETVWEKEGMPEDPHAATVSFLDVYAGLEDDDGIPKFSKYLLFFSDIKVDCSKKDTGKVLRAINEMNCDIDMGMFFYEEDERGNAQVHYKYVFGTDAEGEFFDGVLGEIIILMGIYYDTMKEKLLAI